MLPVQRSRWLLPARVLLVAAVALACWVLVHHLRYQPWHHYFDLSVYQGAVHWFQDGRPLYSYVRPRSKIGRAHV